MQTFPNGGAWYIKVRRGNSVITRLWEELVRAMNLYRLHSLTGSHCRCNQVVACVGEMFSEPDVVGVAVSTRQKDDVLQVWNRDNTAGNVRFAIGSVHSACHYVL